jgi:hypothetical protein
MTAKPHPDLEAEYPPHVLREYALLADGERGILADPRGDFVWMCAPRWHSGAVFSSLIGGGFYAVTHRIPVSCGAATTEEGSLIWRRCRGPARPVQGPCLAGGA